MERLNYFKDFEKIAKEIKEIANRHVKAKVYVFGSIVTSKYSVGLSDIDVAIVSDEFKDREKRLKLYDELFERYFDSPLEFHLLTEKQWKFFLNFIGKNYREV